MVLVARSRLASAEGVMASTRTETGAAAKKTARQRLAAVFAVTCGLTPLPVPLSNRLFSKELAKCWVCGPPLADHTHVFAELLRHSIAKRASRRSVAVRMIVGHVAGTAQGNAVRWIPLTLRCLRSCFYMAGVETCLSLAQFTVAIGSRKNGELPCPFQFLVRGIGLNRHDVGELHTESLSPMSAIRG